MLAVVTVNERLVPMLVNVERMVVVVLASMGMVKETVVVVKDGGGGGLPVTVAITEAVRVFLVVGITWYRAPQRASVG